MRSGAAISGPPQVLAAVDGDHLAGHRRRVDQIAQGLGDLGGTDRPAQQGRGGLGVEAAWSWWIEGRVGPGPMPFTRMRGASAWASIFVASQSAALDSE